MSLSIYVGSNQLSSYRANVESIKTEKFTRFLDQVGNYTNERRNTEKIFDVFISTLCCVNEQVYSKCSDNPLAPSDIYTQKMMNNIYSVNRASKITLENLLIDEEDYIPMKNNGILSALSEKFIPSINSQNRVLSKSMIEYFISLYYDGKRKNITRQTREFLKDVEKTTYTKIQEMNAVSEYMHFLESVRIFGDNNKEYFFRKHCINANDEGEYSKDEFKIERVKSDVKFSDIAGLDEAKRQIDMFARSIRYPEIYKRNDARGFSGILFYGPPGTGKTMLARAMAGELDIDLISIKITDIVSKYFGESERILQRYFDEAKKNGKTILFFDELDALAKQRGGKDSYSATDRIVSTMLVNLDGIEENKNVIPIAATNRLENIDSALKRPGRFSKLIEIPLPDDGVRESLFRIKIHAASKRSSSFGGDGIFGKNCIDYNDLIKATEGMNGAEIEEILEIAKTNRAYMETFGKKTELISTNELLFAIEKYRKDFRGKSSTS